MVRPRKYRRSVSIHMPASLRARRRHRDGKLTNAADVIARMNAFGAVLRLQYRAGKPVWWLEPGGEVEPTTAADVINHPDVTAVGTSLFPDLALPAQTYRFIGN